MTAGFTELLTKQVALTGTETDLGALFGESTGKVRLSVPDAATSSVWLGKKGVSTSDDEYKKGTQTQLPTTSLRGWYAITNGASVTVTIAMATGGVDAPDWITAGTNGASTGGGGGGSAVDQGAGDAASPWFVQGVNGGVPERLATDRATFANPSAARIANADATAFVTPLTDDELRSAPVPTSNATASQLDGHSETIGATTDTDTGSTVVALLKRLKALLAGGLPAALGGSGGLKSEGVGVAGTPAGGVASVQGVAGGTPVPISGTIAATQSGTWSNGLANWLGSTAPTVGQKTATNSIPVILASDNGISPYMPSWPAGQLSPPANQIPWIMVGAGGRPTGGQNWVPFATDTSGRQIVMGSRIARTAHLNSATLPAAGAFTSQAVYTVPEGVTGVTMYVTYTRGAAGGQVKLRPEYGNGTEAARGFATTALVVSGDTLEESIAFRDFVAPVTTDANPQVFAIEIDVPPGCTTIRLLAAEKGVTGTPGTCAIALTAKYGAA